MAPYSTQPARTDALHEPDAENPDRSTSSFQWRRRPDGSPRSVLLDLEPDGTQRDYLLDLPLVVDVDG